jgi:hypothetical protein
MLAFQPGSRLASRSTAVGCLGRTTLGRMGQIKVRAKPDERDALRKARDDVRTVIALVDEELTRCIDAPGPESAIAACVSKDPDRYWLTAAGSAVNVATDHLRALLTSWTDPDGIPHSAGYTLIRGATEAAARSLWLADTKIDARERTVRGILEWDYSIECFGRVDRVGRDYRRTRALFDKTIADAGYAMVGRKIGRRKCERQERPRITELIESLLPTQTGRRAYSLLSGYAHAEVWVMMLNWELAASGKVATTLDVTTHIDLLRGAALRLLDDAVSSLAQLGGHDVAAWKRSVRPLVRGN